MKKTLIILLTIFIAFDAAAQDSQTPSDTVDKWDKGGFTSLAFNQITFSNWAKGGENSISGTALLNLFANFKDTNRTWENTCDFGFGILYSDEFGTRKNEDKIDLNSKFGYRAFEAFYYSVVMNFKSQFDKGYNYPNDSVKVSDFFAPAYLILSIGMDFQQSKEFSVYLSPATGRFIFVNDQTLADKGAFGVRKARYDSSGALIEHGQKFKPNFGAYLTVKFKKEIIKNVGVDSKLDLFNNYTDENPDARGNIDVNWETTINMKVNEFISANLFFHMIYDHEIPVPIYKKVDGVKSQIGAGPRLQFKEVLGIGFSYKF